MFKTVLTAALVIPFSCFSLSFSPEIPTQALPINTNTDDLCQVASSTHAYLAKGQQYDPAVIHSKTLSQFGITPQRVSQTLAFICHVTEQDKQHNRPSRLQSIDFIKQHFDFIRWQPDTANAQKFAKRKPLLQNLPSNQLLMTKYYVHLADGHTAPSTLYPHALYALPYEEMNLSLEEANSQPDLVRHHTKKQTVLQQGISADIAKPLVYLSRKDLESSLLQGTVVVDVEQQQKVFNVHRNNGIAYNRNLKPEEQQRYWFFKEVEGILGYGKDADYKITVKPEVTFAGDIKHLGLGHLLLSQFNFNTHQEYRLAVLADTGGAFDDNLYQLDYLAGSYHGFAEYAKANRHLPDYIDVWFMVIKQSEQ